MMKHQLALLCAVAGLSLGVTAIAHNPDDTNFGHTPTAKLVPHTCDQLADKLNYSDDDSNAEIKALKAGCEEKAKAAPAVAPKTEPAKDEPAKAE
jgi:hypothetical protein